MGEYNVRAARGDARFGELPLFAVSGLKPHIRSLEALHQASMGTCAHAAAVIPLSRGPFILDLESYGLHLLLLSLLLLLFSSVIVCELMTMSHGALPSCPPHG